MAGSSRCCDSRKGVKVGGLKVYYDRLGLSGPAAANQTVVPIGVPSFAADSLLRQ